jgi:hypothetical protein
MPTNCISGHALLLQLKKHGVGIPVDCYAANIDISIDGVVEIHFYCRPGAEELKRIGLAIVMESNDAETKQ